jgi:hypothetical protein
MIFGGPSQQNDSVFVFTQYKGVYNAQTLTDFCLGSYIREALSIAAGGIASPLIYLL